MRPYYTVIKDSFREAFSSRVLWVLLALITLFLAAIAPFGFVEKAPTALRAYEIRDGSEFLSQLHSAGQSAAASPGKHIWGILSPQLKFRAEQDAAGQATEQRDGRRQSIYQEINELLEKPDFYDELAWKNVRLDPEVRALLDNPSDELTEQERTRRNRLLLEAAFPDQITPASGSAIYAAYFGNEFGEALPMEFRHVRQVLEQALVAVVGVLLGVLGTLIAILVTAPIIPHTFEEGAVDLLLSKPVSRSLLFLAKFLGGCAFVLLNATYLIVGLWLIAGLRHGVWSDGLLLSLPVFLFLFAIYYSVSAFAGVVWKGAIISVVMTIVFWLACTVVGTAKASVENFLLNARRLAVLVPANSTLIAANKEGETFEWDAAQNSWEPIFEGADQPSLRFAFRFPLIGPVYDPEGERLLAVESISSRFAFGSGAGSLIVGQRASDWKRTLGSPTPVGTMALFIRPDGQILAVSSSGVHRFEGDPAVERTPFKLFGVDVSRFVGGPKAGKFVSAVTKDFPRLEPPLAAAMHPDGTIAVFTHGKLMLLKEDDQREYSVARETDLGTDEPAVLAYSGNNLIVALGDGTIRVIDAGTLDLRGEYQPFGTHQPRAAIASPNGRWLAALYHNRRLWLFDAEMNRPAELDITGQGDISAVAFAPDGDLLVADRFRRVTVYSLDPLAVKQSYAPESTWLEWIYSYVIVPVHTVFPKPGDLDHIVNYLLTDKQSEAFGGQTDNLLAERMVFDIWEPLWSNLAFLAVMLSATCLYISRKDF